MDPFDNLITAKDSMLLKVTWLLRTETLANVHSIIRHMQDSVI